MIKLVVEGPKTIELVTQKLSLLAQVLLIF